MQETIPRYPAHPFTGDPLPVPKDPVTRVRLPSGDPVWLVTGYDEVKRALSHPLLSRDVTTGDPQVGSAGPIGGYRPGRRTLQMDGAAHTQLRKLAARPFTPRRVSGIRDRVQELTDGLLDRLEALGPGADLVGNLTYPLPMTVITELFGVPAEDRDRFARWATTIVTVVGVSADELDAARAELQGYLGALVRERRAHPGDDVLSGWLTAEEGGDRLSDIEIVQMAQTIIIGGYETTVGLIAGGVLRLLQHPGQLAALRADPALMRTAVEEILRFQPVGIFFLILMARGDLELGGVRIREGEGVMPLPYHGNRDTARFTDPDRFDIHREPAGHIAFGHGPHACLGAALARIEVEVVLARLLRRFPGLRLAVDPSELRWHQDRLTNGIVSLPVAW
ncbi:cytochrome P450 [Streptomyces sp. NPDC057638]|uniref:cytochrome P450 n=1 Tax=Streptomyces sp. NPDC057638 TaxID=3346190 RepID=UPI0036C66142